MCGFAGFISFPSEARSRDERQAILKRMGQALAHRGPDDETFYLDEHISFVFRRLSIIDVAGGAQPIWNEERSMFVAVNGEIYNHRELRRSLEGRHTFSTRSDSETVLHLFEQHGTAAFSMLNGMYSIVLWNARDNSLVLARDRLGIKPLYYAPIEGGLLFGSELKALLMHPRCPRELDWADLAEVGLSQRAQVPTYVKGVRHLPAGGFATLAATSSLKTARYWRIESLSEQAATARTAEACVDEYEALLVDSVQRQLMSDVPIGLFLSGGIDSSLIAAIAAKTGTQFHCFSFAEENTYLSGDLKDSVDVTNALGLPHHPVYFDLTTLLAEIDFDLATLEHFVWMMDSPRFDLEFLFKHEIHRFVKTRFPAVKVLLLGQGADEFSGGYSGLEDGGYKDWDDYLTRSVEPGVRSTFATDRAIPQRLVALLRDGVTGGEQPFRSYRRRMEGYSYQMQHFNLWHEDRTSSSQGREARVPFLDHRLVEFSVGIPSSLQPSLFWNKRIVRDAIARQMPAYPRAKKKIPFFVTAQRRSIQKFSLALLTKVFPAFREKYLTAGDALFAQHSLDALLERALRSGGADEEAVWMALEALCVQIFVTQLGASSATVAPLPELSRASPLLELTAGQRAELGRCFVSDAQSATVGFEFAPGLRFASALPADPSNSQLLVIKDDKVVGKLKLPAAQHWVARWLGAPDTLAKRWQTKQIARETNVALSAVESFVTGLRQRGYIHDSG